MFSRGRRQMTPFLFLIEKKPAGPGKVMVILISLLTLQFRTSGFLTSCLFKTYELLLQFDI